MALYIGVIVRKQRFGLEFVAWGESSEQKGLQDSQCSSSHCSTGESMGVVGLLRSSSSVAEPSASSSCLACSLVSARVAEGSGVRGARSECRSSRRRCCRLGSPASPGLCVFSISLTLMVWMSSAGFMFHCRPSCTAWLQAPTRSDTSWTSSVYWGNQSATGCSRALHTVKVSMKSPSLRTLLCLTRKKGHNRLPVRFKTIHHHGARGNTECKEHSAAQQSSRPAPPGETAKTLNPEPCLTHRGTKHQ